MFARRVAAALISACAFGVSGTSLPAAAPKVPEQVRQLLQDRKYAEAVAAIEAAAQDKSLDQDYLAYLKGRALHFEKKYDEAVAAFDHLNQASPRAPGRGRRGLPKGCRTRARATFAMPS
jgi:hypothetical protein